MAGMAVLVAGYLTVAPVWLRVWVPGWAVRFRRPRPSQSLLPNRLPRSSRLLRQSHLRLDSRLLT